MRIPVNFRRKLAEALEKSGYYGVNVNLQKAVRRPRILEKPADNFAEKYLEYLQKEFLINVDDFLGANPGVAKAPEEGRITSCIFHGRKEGRERSPAGK